MTTPRAARSALDPVALGLLAVSLVVSLVLAGVGATVVAADDVAAMLVLTGALGGWRGWLLSRPGDAKLRRLGFWPALAVSALLVVLSPVYGLYAFLGYLEGPTILRGAPRVAAMLVTAGICALAQMGGPRSVLWSWPMFGLFFAVNAAIALLITLLERQRERMMTDLERTVTELRASEERNAALLQQLVDQARDAGVEEERARLSREIHDTVAQGLVGIITQLEAAQAAEPADRDLRLERAGAAARESLGEARRAVRALASPRLDSESLSEALDGLVRQAGESSGLAARFVVDGDPVPTRSDAELLRVAQESLANVSRHAGASRVVVTLGYFKDEVRLDVNDDGRGFDPYAASSGQGLPGIRQRLARLGGALEIETSEGGGCTITAAAPR